MNKDFYFVTKGYLYTPWNGKIKELEGEVWHRDECQVYQYNLPESTKFRVINKHGPVVKSMCCSALEAEVCNKVVWLTESNMCKAAEILIEYEESQISKLEFQIENHKRLIETYKEHII